MVVCAWRMRVTLRMLKVKAMALFLGLILWRDVRRSPAVSTG